MFSKAVIQEFYSMLLREIEKAMGSGQTDNFKIDRFGRGLFKSRWKGVFSSDENYPSKGYCIVNLDPSDKPGSHWVAVANGHVYDSFGRCNLLDSDMKCAGDGKADQKTNEDNCGQRSLAWLCVHQATGLQGANLV